MTDIKHIFLALPTYQNIAHVPCMLSVFNTVAVLAERGVRVTISHKRGDAMICRSRSVLLANFLNASDCDAIWFVDSDLSWDPKAAADMLLSPLDFVGGVYPYKQDETPLPQFPLTWAWRFEDGREATTHDEAKQEKVGIDTSDGLYEVRMLAGGFMRVTRTAAQAIWDAHPELQYLEKQCQAQDDAGNAWARYLFQPFVVNGGLHSEDAAFCRRYRQLGGRIWADARITFTHYGEKAYDGNLAAVMDALTKAQAQQQRDGAIAEAAQATVSAHKESAA